MGDHILVLHGGKIQQMGTPLELYNQPANTFVAGFIGSPQMNLAKAQLTEKGLVLNNDLVVPLTQEERAHLPQGSQWQIGVRAEQIEPASPGEEDTCLVYTQSTEMMGNETQVLFNVGETLFTARWTGQYSSTLAAPERHALRRRLPFLRWGEGHAHPSCPPHQGLYRPNGIRRQHHDL